MYVFIVSVICALMLGAVYLMAYGDFLTGAVVTFLLFVAIDSGLRAAVGKPSWVMKVAKSKRGVSPTSS